MDSVYLAVAWNGLFKIGISANPENRIKALNMQSPITIQLIASYPHEEAKACERELQEKWFPSKRVKGEWFRLGKEDVSVFRWFFESMKGDRDGRQQALN